MDLLHAFIFGVVEGFTEFLPVSSTGHLLLAAKLMRLPQTDFLKTFEISIQSGAIFAVLALYRKELFLNSKRVLSAFLPTAFGGILLYKSFKGIFLAGTNIVLPALFFGGIFLIFFELLHKEKKDSPGQIKEISYKQAFIIGAFQILAVIPGVSRSAATIVGGLAIGLKRKTTVEFSFLLAVPTMLAATALDLVKQAPSFSLEEFKFLLVGFITSFIVALLSIKFLLAFIRRNSFAVFGLYRVLIALLFWFIVL